ncbi:hypothetical protein B0T14DRAFT_492049 [Immersiella caudata]|uniref:Uncharacterized protein n=1 Tax=Immersiella caudata TaxID=314043 RepID=A0AA40CCQ7_9PEZI|nr:hypothetical protein B0T14DRAFT_492049 [Immersiella caudata]
MDIDTFNAWAATYEQSTGGVTRQVATHILILLPLPSLLTRTFTILCNAPGTGTVTSEPLKLSPPFPPHRQNPPRRRLPPHDNHRLHRLLLSLSTAVMPAESLTFPSNTLTHSITNIGILVFSDGAKGAREIYRTLKPDGVAIVASWSFIGFAKPLAEASLIITPEGKAFSLPIDTVWFDTGYLEKIMCEAGFGEGVEMQEEEFLLGWRV